MSRLPAILPVCVVALTLFASASLSCAQTLRASGIIGGVKPGFIKVTAGGSDVVLKVEAKKENILVEAEAELEWLQRGMLVRFEAHLDQQGVAEGTIKELTVFTARKGYGVGVMLDKPGAGQVDSRNPRNKRKSRAQRIAEARAAKANRAKNERPNTKSDAAGEEVEERAGEGAGKDTADNDDANNDNADNDDADNDDADNDDADQPKSDLPVYLVAGKLERLSENRILVIAGREQVKATLSESVKIKVDIMGDYSLAQEGDKIDFTARQIKPGRAVAKRLKITLDAPLQAKRATTVNEKRRRSRPATPRDRAVDAALND